MKTNKRIIWISVIAVILSIISIEIAFAALSQVLTIKGSTKLDQVYWNIRFDTMSLSKTTTGDAIGSIPIITASAIEFSKVTLTKPGDAVTYTFDVINDGILNAKIESIIGNPNSLPAPFDCKSINVTSEEIDEEKVCAKINYTLKYTNDDINNLPTIDLRNQFVTVNDDFPKKTGITETRVKMELKIEFNPDTEVDEMSADDVEIKLNNLVITYMEKTS